MIKSVFVFYIAVFVVLHVFSAHLWRPNFTPPYVLAQLIENSQFNQQHRAGDNMICCV